MVIDCCPLFNELDLLELRLRELYHVVDRFVIAEAPVTHKGDPKPLHYAQNAARFAEWADKIEYIVVTDMPGGEGLAAIRRREMHQRNALLRGLRGVPDDAVVLISDLDEIPRPGMLPTSLLDGVVVTYIQRLYYYNFNTSAPDRPWPGTRAARAADVRALSPHIIRNGMGQPDAHYPRHAHLTDAGWHFSYFGGVDRIREKQTQFLHQELVTDENTAPSAIAARVARGIDIWGREAEQQFVIGPAADLPYSVISDPMRWRHLFAAGWEPEFHEDWYDGGQALYMAALAREAPDGAIVEIGCWEGRSTVVLAQLVAPREIYCVDWWKGNPEEGADHPAAVAAAERNVWGAYVNNMDRLTSGNYTTIHRSWQEWISEWPHCADDPRIAFLHLDAAHDYESVRDCLLAIKPLLVPGAILCGDDAYAAPVLAGARDALGDGVRVEGGRLWVWRNE